MESSNSNSKERELQLTQRLAKQRHSICMTWFEQLETHLHDLYLLNSPYAVDAFKPAFRSFFGEEHQTFKLKMFHNLDQLRLQLERENLHGVNAKTCLKHSEHSSRNFCLQKGKCNRSSGIKRLYRVVNKYVYTHERNELNALKENGSQLHDEILHEHQIKSSVKMQSQDIQINPVQAMDDSLIMQRQEEKVNMREAVDAGLVVTESSGTKPEKQDTSSSSGNYTTQAVDADIGPVNDDEPFAEVQLTALHNIFANEQQHTEQSEPNYDTHLLETTIDSNTTPTSTNMCHRGGEIDQNALLNAELLKTKDMLLARTTLICNLKKQIKSVKETSNEAKVKNNIDVIETINIELEHSVAKLLAANEQLHKENEHLKQTYKELFDSIKKTKVQNKDNSESLISQINQKSVENADLKAQLQEKVFANAALKNELRKIKGNSVDSKFAKASILGKPPLQPSRNHLVVRQPNAFTSERPRISRPRFASQVDEKNDLSKTVTPHYLPKVRESAAAKPHQVNAPNYSRNSQSYGSNDMVHAYFLEDARKMTQDKTGIPSHKDMASTRAHCTPNACTPKPRNIYRSSPVSKCSGGMSNGEPLVDHSRNSSFFLDSKQFVCSICHKYIFNTNHDDCIIKILNKVNSRAKVQSPKIRNNNPVEPKNHTHKPGRQNGIGQRFSLNKSSAVHEKPHTPRSCLRWKPTGRIFKTVSLRWIPTGKMFTDSTTKVDSEPPNGSNDDITNPYECNQTLYVSAGTSNSSAGTSVNPLKERLGASFFILMSFGQNSSSLVLHQKMFGQYSSGLVLHLDDVWTNQFKPRSSSNDVWTKQFKPRSSSNDICDSNVEYLRANLNIKGMSNSRRTSLSNIDYMLYPSLLRTVTDWKGKPSLRSTELTEAEEEAVAREVHATHARIVSGPDPEPMQEDQTGSNSGKLHVSLAGPNPEHMDDELTEAEEEAVAREVHATHARIVSGPDLEPMQKDKNMDQT
ncbi:hypothetical protein Tco_0532227 [Tanacetum coccineum]